MKKYSVLIIDLKKSRLYSHSDRKDIQNYMKYIILVLNKVFHNALELDVIFSGGDEVQGLFSTPQAAYLYLRMFQMLISPVEIRAGIGVGNWDIKIDSRLSTEQDGTAYHNARYAIDNVDNALGYYALLYSTGINDVFINSAINMEKILLDNQSQYQNELFIVSELLYPIDYDCIEESYSLLEISRVIQKKRQIDYFLQGKTNQQIKKYPLDMIEEWNALEYHPINVNNEKSELYISSGKIKGLSNRLANLLGISRQSIDKSLKSGNVFQARNCTHFILKLMDEQI